MCALYIEGGYFVISLSADCYAREMQTIKRIINILASILFPIRCIGCDKENEAVCYECIDKLPRSARNGTIDPDIMSVFDYRNPVMKRALWLLKYGRHRHLCDHLGAMLYEYLIDDLAERSVISHFTDPVLIPIPITRSRKRTRGFNQAEALAQAIARRDPNLIVMDVLEKIRDTTPQAKLKNRVERLNNLAGCFRVTDPSSVHGRNIIVIDDIATTGATISEAKRVLKKAGARKIIGLTVAH